jgi:hypothetical protein
MKLKHLFFFSLGVLIFGIVLNLYAYFSKCENVIKRNINKDVFDGKRTVAYIVQNVQTYCRPCMDYEQLREAEDNIVFYVTRDFTDIDIENFRRVFKIRNKDRILRIGKAWQKLTTKCKDGKRGLSNFLVLIDKFGKAEQVKRF